MAKSNCERVIGRPPEEETLSWLSKLTSSVKLFVSKLTNIETGLKSLKSTIDAKAHHAEQDVRSHLDAVNKRIEQDRAKVTAAQAEVKNWVDEQKAATSEKIAEWKTKRERPSCNIGPKAPSATPTLRSSLRQRHWMKPSTRCCKPGARG